MQPSQQSFSQGLSFQHGMFSQLSQSSLDEVVTNDQRLFSQERENSVKKFPCISQLVIDEKRIKCKCQDFPPIQCPNGILFLPQNREVYSFLWTDKGQISEELDCRIGMMETSLNWVGIILDSVQSDVIQVNRGSKEVLLEVQGICQKLVVQDTLLHLMVQEDVKARIDGGLKSLSDQLGKNLYEDKFKEIFVELSSLPGKIEASLLKLRTELCSFLAKEKKAMACSMKSPNQKGQVATVTLQKRTGSHVTSQRKPKPLNNLAAPPKANVQGIHVAKVEMGGWKSVKKVQATLKLRVAPKGLKWKGVSSAGQVKECRIIIDSDEEIDGGLSCLINKKEIGNNENKRIEDVKAETERILRKARRQKRKYDNPIIIN